MFKFPRLALVTCLLLAVTSIASFGQSTVTGGISGLVTDPNGAVVPNAGVTVRNSETNKEDSATTDSEGRYRVVNLQPGTYVVTIKGQGFGAFTQERVVVEVGRLTDVSPALSVGQASADTVSITTDAPVINTEAQDFSTNINQTSLNNLPTNGRRWSNMAILTPGATPDGNFGLISFRGISGLLNNSTVDGGDNNQAFFSEERGRTRIGYVISQAAIREFQVNTSNYSAEYGRAAGAVVNAVTKSGTNEFHGSGFLYDRNNKLGARNPQSVVNGVGYKAPDVRYQFGGAIGGPIVKDKAFFFFSYDQQKRNFPGVARFGALNFLSTANNAGLLTRGLTQSQIDSGLAFLNSLTGPTPRRGDQKLFLPKLDWNINPNNTFTASYNRLRWASPAGVQTGATVTRDRNGFGDDFVTTDTLNARLASTLSAKMVNEFRFSWSHELDSQFAQPALPGEPTTANGLSPQVAVGGSTGITFGKSTGLDRRALPDEKRLQFADTMTVTSGNHSLKFGGDINHIAEIYDELFTEAGSYTYANINDFLVDYTNFTTNGSLRTAGKTCFTQVTPVANTRLAGKCYTSNYGQGFGPAKFDFSTMDYAFFGQDDWRVNSRVTLNLGLRWEYEHLPHPFSALINPALPQTANRPNDKNNFGPRVGLALMLTPDGKTSLRGGYGIYYGRVNGSAITQALINTDVPGQSQIVASVAAAAPNGTPTAQLPAGNPAAPIFPNVLPSAPLGTATVNYFQDGFQNPLIQQGDIIFEREIARNMAVSASYLVSFGRDLPNFVDTNLSPATGTRSVLIQDGPYSGMTWTFPTYFGNRPNTNFAQIQEIRSNITTRYQALVLQANRRLTKGLQFQTSYTLSKSKDNGQNSQTFTPTFSAPFDPMNQPAESGYSAFDRRHKFVASAVYNTNFDVFKDNAVGRAIFNGWTIAPIVNIFSGFRYTGVTNGFSPSTTTFGTTQNGGINGANGSLRFAFLPNNFFKAPAIKYVDLRLSRRFAITEKSAIEILAEGFNILNRTQTTGVVTQIYTLSASGSNLVANFNSSFGQPNAADGFFFRERQIQLAVRFEF